MVTCIVPKREIRKLSFTIIIRDSTALWLASFRPRMKNDFWTDKNSGLSPAEETKHSLAIPHGVVCGAKLN